MTTHARYLEPLDVLFLRGNKLFGDPGSYGESLVPPWPSVAAGALRSRILVDDRIDLDAFARGEVDHPALGTPAVPGAFTVAVFQIARRRADGRVEMLIAPPADMVIHEADGGATSVSMLAPTNISPNDMSESGTLQCSAPLEMLPVLAETGRSKPAGGFWLTESGWKSYLAGKAPGANQLLGADALWKLDHRVGVGLDNATGRASDGRLFSVQAVAFEAGIGFIATITGAEPPRSGTLRLGGDGRAAAVRAVDWVMPEADYDAILRAKRCRLVLSAPGIFAQGWLPTGVTRTADGAYRLDLHGVRARLVCAAVPRAEVVSGWDLALRRPKPALRTVPVGSVYWLDDLEATPETLRKLVSAGLWREPCQDDDASRRAEGFNRAVFAVY